MLDIRQIHPLTDFLRNHKAHVARLKETRTPDVLTPVAARSRPVRSVQRASRDLLSNLDSIGSS